MSSVGDHFGICTRHTRHACETAGIYPHLSLDPFHHLDNSVTNDNLYHGGLIGTGTLPLEGAPLGLVPPGAIV